MSERKSTKSSDIKELCSFDDAEEAAVCVEVQKILSEQPEDQIKASIIRRRRKPVPRVDSGCGSPCVPSTLVSETESEEETALTEEEAEQSLYSVSNFHKIVLFIQF